MKIYTENNSWKSTKSMKETLALIPVDASRFTREAVSEKLKREYKHLMIKPKNIEGTF